VRALRACLPLTRAALCTAARGPEGATLWSSGPDGFKSFAPSKLRRWAAPAGGLPSSAMGRSRRGRVCLADAAPLFRPRSYPCLGAQFSKDGSLVATWQGDGARLRTKSRAA
jgi:hypothetical protein